MDYRHEYDGLSHSISRQNVRQAAEMDLFNEYAIKNFTKYPSPNTITYPDIATVKTLLRNPCPGISLPLELIDQIVDSAEYWVDQTFETFPRRLLGYRKYGLADNFAKLDIRSELLLATPQLGRWRKIQVEILSREVCEEAGYHIRRPDIRGRPAASWISAKVVKGSGVEEGSSGKDVGDEVVLVKNGRAVKNLVNPLVAHTTTWRAGWVGEKRVRERCVDERVRELQDGTEKRISSAVTILSNDSDGEKGFVEALRAEDALQVWAKCVGLCINNVDKCSVTVWHAE